MYKPDKEFLAHMEEMDRKRARAYKLDLEREEGDNYSAMMIDTQPKRSHGWIRSLK